MNIQEIKLEINNSRLNINLLLYRTVKDIIQAKITHKQVIILIEKVKLLIASNESFETKKSIFTKSINDLSRTKSVQTKIITLIENSIIEDIHFNVFKLSLNIIRFKSYILEQSKLYSDNFRASDNIHIMDFQYDQNMLNAPYSVRVSGALLIKVLFSKIEENENDFYEPIKTDIKKIVDIDPETILQIIFAESASQSIRSKSGSSYEDRFQNVLSHNNIKFQTQSFDKNIQAVEYDFKIFLPKNKLVAVSVKRTLRERYKQNHENIDELEVDAMILITLGIDLNKVKVDNILKKEKYFIFVASDLYKKFDYFHQNDKVYPISSVSNQVLEKLVS